MSEEHHTELRLGYLAADLIANAGGYLSFEEYDKLMFPVIYFPPISWIQGWGLPKPLWKSNMDKLCVFAAVKYGLVEPTPYGYRIPS